jgi:hypothetical protein
MMHVYNSSGDRRTESLRTAWAPQTLKGREEERWREGEKEGGRKEREK